MMTMNLSPGILHIYILYISLTPDDYDLKNDDNEGHQRLDDTELEGALLAEPGDMETLDLRVVLRFLFGFVGFSFLGYLRNPML